VKLKTRESDGAALCALESQDAPSRYAPMSAQMPNAPGVVGCSMTCTADYQCQHFNYVATDSEHPCHLYYYRPTYFDQQPNCQHYETPGKTGRRLQLRRVTEIVRMRRVEKKRKRKEKENTISNSSSSNNDDDNNNNNNYYYYHYHYQNSSLNNEQ